MSALDQMPHHLDLAAQLHLYCGDNQRHVLFSSNGAQAWGLLMTGSNQHWPGHLDAALQRVILEAKS
jgi:hypothetical protein